MTTLQRPCDGNHPGREAQRGPYVPGSCRVCWLWLNDDRYNRSWGGAGVRRPKLPCRHLGQATGQTAPCPTCPNGTQGHAVPLLACAVHGTTTGLRGAPGQRSCHGCKEHEPDTFRLVAPVGTQDQPCRWEGRVAQRPWHFRVTACIPHLETPEPLALVLETLRCQSERPYILVIDTGSSPETCRVLERLRAEDCEIHYIRGHGYINSSGPVTTALDLSMALCRTDYLYTTHADVFLLRRDYLAWLLSQCGPHCPAIGYEMSDRSWATDLWQGMVSHTASLFHVPTLRRAGVIWSMEYGYELAGWTGQGANGWPDTETGANLIMRRAGIVPRLLGPESNYRLHRDGNLIHVRSYAGSTVYQPGNGYHVQAARWMAETLAEVRGLVRSWGGTVD